MQFTYPKCPYCKKDLKAIRFYFETFADIEPICGAIVKKERDLDYEMATGAECGNPDCRADLKNFIRNDEKLQAILPCFEN